MNSFIDRLRLSRRLASLRRTLGVREPSAETVFTRIYEKNLWADTESRSGRGSTLARTETIRNNLPQLLESVGAGSLLDAACGDFNWMAQVDLRSIHYFGVDVVPDLIARNQEFYARAGRSFNVANITRDPLAEVDVVLCRDCLIHHS